MQNLIKDGQPVSDDAWHWVEDDTAAAPGNAPVILPLARYLEERDQWKQAEQPVGVWLNDEQMVEDVADLLDDISLIALHFPKFADGRGFSKARLLRDRHGYEGEIRAIGDFLPDQAFYMHRCGINAFACRTADEADTTARLLDTFSVHYQSDVRQAPLFQQR